MIDFVSPVTSKKLILKDDFFVSENGEKFPVVNGIPRFVEQNNYANAFGLQWKIFAKTQLDSHTGTKISQERLERCLGFPVSELKRKNILEVGCGAGRFTELFVKAGALTHSVDLSVAVEANKENIGEAENYRIAQANVYELPFPGNSFDVVICLGVIQHTPSSEKTISALWKMVKPGGLLVIDHYKWRISYYTNLAPVYRFFLRRMKPESSKRKVDALVDFFFPLHWKFRNNKIINGLLYRISGLLFYHYQFPGMSREFHYELTKLDTYDALTDFYKHLKTPSQINKILHALAGAKDIWVAEGGNGVEARCRKRININEDNTGWTPSEEDNKLGLIDKNRINEYEAKGIASSELYVFQLDTEIQISTTLVLEIHRLAFSELYDWAGKWRTIEVSVGQFTPPIPNEVVQLMYQYIDNLNFKIAQAKGIQQHIDALTFAHYEFVRIHPFNNGNGRAGRILMNIAALKFGYKPLELYHREGDSRKIYIDSMRAADKGNFE